MFETPNLKRNGYVTIHDNNNELDNQLIVGQTFGKALNQFSSKLSLSKFKIGKQILGARQSFSKFDRVKTKAIWNENAPRNKILQFQRKKLTSDKEVQS